MSQEIWIKNQRIGAGQPIVCIPIMGKTNEAVKSQIRQGIKAGVPMLEWRLDWYQTPAVDEVVGLLLEMKPELTNTILLCTFRSRSQGGEKTLAKQEYLALNLAIAASGCADFVDIEFLQVTNPVEIIQRIQKEQVRVIASHHVFSHTPQSSAMEQQLLAMLMAGSDIAKLAVMPKDKLDVLNLMEAVQRVKVKQPDSLIAAMSMGNIGVPTRFLSEWFGSVLTFGYLGTASAPGQISYQTLVELTSEIHNLAEEGTYDR